MTRATVWLDRGRTRRLEEGFGAFEAWRDTLLEQEELEQHKLDRRIAMEEHWVRYGVTARRKRNQGRMARLASLRQQRRDHRRVQGNVLMAATEAEGSGSIVIEAKELSKGWNDTRVVDNVSLRVARGDRIGIVGPNGSGKTTLLSLLTERLPPDTGSVRIGSNVRMHVLDQRRQTLDADVSVKDFLTGGHGETLSVGEQVRHYASYMKDFLFTPEQARTPVSALSGGERGRLVLAKALATPANLLVLDEPTNDLDLETLDLLQELLADYAGTVIVVSHDRDFLDRVATAVIWAEGNGRFTEYAGGFSDAVAQRGEDMKARTRSAAAASRPKSRDAEPTRASETKKLSFKDKHALETLPGKMEALRASMEEMKAALADPALYARDPKRFTSLSEKLGQATTELAGMEDRWLELEILRESLQG